MTKAERIIENVQRVIVGKEDLTKLLLTALLANGHVLLEDVPGTGKTMLAKSLARSVDLEFNRVQFTADLLPSDITGINYYNQKTGEFVLRKGPAFCNILLADEINRSTPRTQSALLECMEERQISIDGETLKLSRPFFVIATQNPVETAGTYQLPEAQIDRFMMKLSMGEPSAEEERMILDRFLTEQPLDSLAPVCTPEELKKMQNECKEVYMHPALRNYIVEICQKTREYPDVLCGASPRATLALSLAARAYAYIRNREFVVPEDIKKLAVPVLAHRLILTRGGTGKKRSLEVILKCLEQCVVPTEDWSR